MVINRGSDLLYLGYGNGDKPAFFGISAIQICPHYLNWLPLFILVVFIGTWRNKSRHGHVLIVFNAYSDRAGIACPKKLDSWCGLDRFGIGQIYLWTWLVTDVWESLEPWLGILKQYWIDILCQALPILPSEGELLKSKSLLTSQCEKLNWLWFNLRN